MKPPQKKCLKKKKKKMLRNWPEVENNLWLARTWVLPFAQLFSRFSFSYFQISIQIQSSFFFLVLIISFRASCLPAGQQSAAQAFHTCQFRFEKQKMLLVVNARVTDPSFYFFYRYSLSPHCTIRFSQNRFPSPVAIFFCLFGRGTGRFLKHFLPVLIWTDLVFLRNNRRSYKRDRTCVCTFLSFSRRLSFHFLFLKFDFVFCFIFSLFSFFFDLFL